MSIQKKHFLKVHIMKPKLTHKTGVFQTNFTFKCRANKTQPPSLTSYLLSFIQLDFILLYFSNESMSRLRL